MTSMVSHKLCQQLLMPRMRSDPAEEPTLYRPTMHACHMSDDAPVIVLMHATEESDQLGHDDETGELPPVWRTGFVSC